MCCPLDNTPFSRLRRRGRAPSPGKPSSPTRVRMPASPSAMPRTSWTRTTPSRLRIRVARASPGDDTKDSCEVATGLRKVRHWSVD